MTCPANPVQNAESGSSTGQPSPTQEQGASQILHAQLSELIAVMHRTAASNEAMVQAIGDLIYIISKQEDEDEEQPAGTYLDGSPMR